MASPLTTSTIQTDTWIPATWSQFVAVAYSDRYQNGRAYYDHGYMRIEMAPLGSAHGQDNSLISTVVTLYGLAKNLPLKELINTSFRKSGVRECQPDLAYYIGSALPQLPRDNAPIDVDRWGAPTLVVEIGATSFSDDLGSKRLLYEQLGVEEYWVINTAAKEAIAFAVSERRSGRISASQVLPALTIALVNKALQRSTTEDTSAIGRWLFRTYSESD
ncbi:MAG: Uma2 family endonuclease [Cyanobacteria bacterium P01_C01_bin.120]